MMLLMDRDTKCVPADPSPTMRLMSVMMAAVLPNM
jgi:hypothetical protein